MTGVFLKAEERRAEAARHWPLNRMPIGGVLTQLPSLGPPIELAFPHWCRCATLARNRRTNGIGRDPFEPAAQAERWELPHHVGRRNFGRVAMSARNDATVSHGVNVDWYARRRGLRCYAGAG